MIWRKSETAEPIADEVVTAEPADDDYDASSWRPGEGVLITRVVAAGVVVLSVAVAILLPSGEQTPTYRLAGEHQSARGPQLTDSVVVPGATLPNAAVSGPGTGAATPPDGASAATPLDSVPLGTGGGTPDATTGAPSIGGPVALSPGAGGTTLPGASPLPLQKPCSLGWPAPGPDQQGGLQSLIGIAPAFGPFSSEAFALGSVYQPLLQLAGPVLAEIEPVLAANQSFLAPYIARVQAIEAVVLEAILPFYGPYRQQFLDAEVALGRVLTPILQRAYASDAASCFVAWEAQIISRAKGKPITVASLTRPGTVIRLGPHL